MQARFTFIELSMTHDDNYNAINCIYTDELLQDVISGILDNVTDFLNEHYKTPDNLDRDFDLFSEAHSYAVQVIESFDEINNGDKTMMDFCIAVFLITFRLWYENWGVKDLFSWMNDPDVDTKPCMSDRSYTVKWALDNGIRCVDYLTLTENEDREVPAEMESSFYRLMAKLKEVLGDTLCKMTSINSYDEFWKQYDKSCFTIFMTNYLHLHCGRFEKTNLSDIVNDHALVRDLYMRIVETTDNESLKKEMLDDNNKMGFTVVLMISVAMYIALKEKGLDFIKEVTTDDCYEATLKRLKNIVP